MNCHGPETRIRRDTPEQQLKGARQKNMELAASLAQMEISASSHLKVEESVGVYKDTIDQARGRGPSFLCLFVLLGCRQRTL